MNRSVYDNALAVISGRRSQNPISRKELRDELITLCGIEIAERDLQSIVIQLQQDGHRIIGDNRGYWLAVSAQDCDAIRKAANVLRLHAQSEIQKADWLDRQADQLQYADQANERRRKRNEKQVGLWT